MNFENVRNSVNMTWVFVTEAVLHLDPSQKQISSLVFVTVESSLTVDRTSTVELVELELELEKKLLMTLLLSLISDT